MPSAVCGYCVIDVETTGLDASHDVLVEVAAIRTDHCGRVVGEMSSLVRAAVTGAEFVHGITADDLCDAPAFGELAPHLQGLWDAVTVVAHNAAFDTAFLQRALEHEGLRPSWAGTACTRALAEPFRPAGASRSLQATCRRFGLPADTPHRALADARATAALLRALLALDLAA